jgi:hypothetical protein
MTLTLPLLAAAGSRAGNPASQLLWYDKPATNWEQEALPIGNGRLGAMIFGGTDTESIQFNEDTLWIGDETDTGAYQAFGDLIVDLGGSDRLSVECASGQTSPEEQSVEASIDGDPATKWCVGNNSKPVIWLRHFPEAMVVSAYAFTSGGDMPDRDPKSWTLEGSNNGQSWTLLDKRVNEPPFPGRRLRKEYTFANELKFQHYRLTFFEHGSPSHFQVAEIEFGEISNADLYRREVERIKQSKPATAYRRELDISRAVHAVTYTRNGVTYRREYFASRPAQAMVFRFTADKPGGYTGTISFADAHKGSISAEGNRLIAKGNLAGYSHSLSGKNPNPYGITLDYEAQAVVLNDGGTVEGKDGQILFSKVNTLTILLDAGTDYVNQRSQNWRGKHPHDAITRRLSEASNTPYDKLLADHIKDYQSLFNRLTLDLGTAPESSRQLPTDLRLAAYRGSVYVAAKVSEKDGTTAEPDIKGVADPGLETLLFQYARYLMISSSRPGTLPANLQGLWNNSNNPPWRCDYHSDINLQMNYWFVDAANLNECFQPLAEWLYSVIPVRRDATKKEFGTRGWMMRSENGIFGGATYLWVPGDAAWLAQNIWDHYAFTRDRDYLKTRAYPIMKELCEFWEDFLKEGPGGTLVSPKSVSPEHGAAAEGNSYEQQLVYDLFTNTIEASQALGVDEDFRAKVVAMRQRLLGPQIGKWGQLQEWAQDIDDPKEQHRHLSHLIAVHPGRQISPLTTPELAEAAKVSMNARGDKAQGWSRAWKISIWARLLDGDRSYSILNSMVKEMIMPNLLDTCPPFQIDGNFGYASGVCEMLIQSHMGEIDLLPALPKAWPTGSVQGICARGGFVVDMDWKDGKLTEARITSNLGGTIPVRYGDKVIQLKTETHGSYILNSQLETKS